MLRAARSALRCIRLPAFAGAAATLCLCVYAFVRFGPFWPAIAILSLGMPLFALLGFVGSLARLATGRDRLAVMLCLLATASLVDSLEATLWSSWSAPPAGARTHRIVEFNAWMENRDPETASRWILAQRPEAVVLLEASGAGQVIADRLAAALPYRMSCHRTVPCSTVILSRIRPIETRPLAQGDANNRRALSAVLARFPEYTLVAVHLSRPTSAARQIAEVEQLIADVGRPQGEGIVVTGDFNAPLWSRPMRRLGEGLRLRALAPDPPSWPAPPTGSGLPPIFPIDHTWLGSGWAAARQTRGRAIGSDHYPALIELIRSGATDVP